MMLSNDIANLADWVAGKAKANEPLGPQTTALLAQTLMDLSERARQMEIAPIRLCAEEAPDGF